jgi:hypothetical protein
MSKANRKHHRYPLFSVAELQVKDSADPPSTVLVQNISESGIGLYAHSPIERGTPIAVLVKFTTIDGTRAADMVEGRVTSLMRDEKFHCLGIAFNEKINQEKQPHLYRHFHRSVKYE